METKHCQRRCNESLPDERSEKINQLSIFDKYHKYRRYPKYKPGYPPPVSGETLPNNNEYVPSKG